MRVCHEFGYYLDEYLQRQTHRRHKATLIWLEEEKNNPSRSDWYAMQIAAEIKSGRLQANVEIKEMKLPFRRPLQPGDPGYFEITPEMEEKIMRASHGMI